MVTLPASTQLVIDHKEETERERRKFFLSSAATAGSDPVDSGIRESGNPEREYSGNPGLTLGDLLVESDPEESANGRNYRKAPTSTTVAPHGRSQLNLARFFCCDWYPKYFLPSEKIKQVLLILVIINFFLSKGTIFRFLKSNLQSMMILKI